MKRIYLDNQTATRASEGVIKGMIPFYREYFADVMSPYTPAQEQIPFIEKAYASLYKLLGAKKEDTIAFCSSGAEAVNQVVLAAYLDITRKSGKNHFVTSKIDEAPVIMAMHRLEPLGTLVKFADVEKSGAVSKKTIQEAITPRTALISLSWANGLTGVINPVQEIAAVCKERGILFHLDATHVLGKLSFDLEEIGADLISFNGIRGSGALWIRSGVQISPLIMASSLNVAGLIGLGIAADELLSRLDFLCTEVARLRNLFESRLLKEVEGASVLFQESERVCNCCTIAFSSVCNESLLYLLNRKGVYASFGGGAFQKISIALQACGIESQVASSALSFALSYETTEEEIEEAVSIISKSVKQLRKVRGNLC